MIRRDSLLRSSNAGEAVNIGETARTPLGLPRRIAEEDCREGLPMRLAVSEWRWLKRKVNLAVSHKKSSNEFALGILMVSNHLGGSALEI